jgi:hypothetical protein
MQHLKVNLNWNIPLKLLESYVLITNLSGMSYIRYYYQRLSKE